MNEATKSKVLFGELERKIMVGSGIDIGCGPDPVFKNVRRFDVDDGDANKISRYVDEQFDFVFSSHTLEHMDHPQKALAEWWKLVKTGGHLIFIVPDEDLYEQGYFPSLFNPDHKATFTINKNRSWSPRSFNIVDLVRSLSNIKLLRVQLQDNHYKRCLLNHSVYPWKFANLVTGARNKAIHYLSQLGFHCDFLFLSYLLRFPIDQTKGRALAQIQTIVKKTV